MAENIATLLNAALTGNNDALQELGALAQEDLAKFLVTSMTGLVCNEEVPPNLRCQAAVFCKNLFYRTERASVIAVTQQWFELPDDVRKTVKDAATSVLVHQDADVRKGASALVVRLAVMEMAQGQWLDLIDQLATYINDASVDSALRVTMLSTLGWICEDVTDFETAPLETKCNDIMTAVVFGMRDDEESLEVRASAAHALSNALAFVAPAFQDEDDCAYLMGVIFSATEANSARVREEAFSCLWNAVTLYYESILGYVNKIFECTVETLNKEDEEETVKLQALEFWASLSDKETEIQDRAWDAGELGQPAPQKLHEVTKGVFPYFAEHLLNVLPVPPGSDPDLLADSDDWTLAMSAATCLKSIAGCIADDVVEHVMPFIVNHIASEDWRLREAAVMAFGSILDGPENEIAPHLPDALPKLLELMSNDASLCVRDTSAWAVGVLCQINAATVCQPALMEDLMGALVNALSRDDDPSVASSACWAIDSLADCVNDGKAHADVTLDPYFGELVTHLLDTTVRDDADESNLRVTAFEALNTVIKAAPESTYDNLLELVPTFVERLIDLTNRKPLNGMEAQGMREEQDLCCSTLQAITQKVPDRITEDYASLMMDAYIKVFEASGDDIPEDTLLAVGALANATEENFAQYMEAFAVHLAKGLHNTQAPMICNAAVGLIGDCCRSLQGDFTPYLKDTMELLLAALSVEDVDKELTLSIIACFGDIAIATGSAFYSYTETVMSILQMASATQVDETDFEQVEYLRDLWTAILDALVGIINGYSVATTPADLPEETESVVHYALLFCLHVDGNNAGEDSRRSLVGLLLDVARVLADVDPDLLRVMSDNEAVVAILEKASSSTDSHTADAATFALSILNQE